MAKKTDCRTPRPTRSAEENPASGSPNKSAPRTPRRKVLLGAFLLHRLENDRDFGKS